MRKFLVILLMIVCLIVLVNNIENVEEEIRVRIVPNNNSEQSKLEKQKVKDIVVCFLKEAYDKSYEIYIKNIEKGLYCLEDVIKNKIEDDVVITFGNHTLYNKTYNNTVLKNTSELTLLIMIGNGNGDNWWGTVYPDFLLINSSDVVEYESIFVNFYKKIREDAHD